MRKISYIFLIIAFILFILRGLPGWSSAWELYISDWGNDDIYCAYDDSVLGKIYHMNTLEMPDDSLVEYRWGRNHILKGQFKIAEEGMVNYVINLQKKEDNIKKSYSSLSIGSDSMVIYQQEEIVGEGIAKSYIMADNDNSIIYVFGRNYELDDIYRLGILLVYDDVLEYTIEVYSDIQ